MAQLIKLGFIAKAKADDFIDRRFLDKLKKEGY